VLAAAAVATGCTFSPGTSGLVLPDSDGGMPDGDGIIDAAVDAGPCTWSPWGTPQPIMELNSGTLDSRPRLSPDETMLYFYSTRPGGAGNRDIYVATRESVTDPFGTPVNLEELNSTVSDRDPAPTADGLQIFFASTRAGGNHDLYAASRSDTSQPFSTPERLVALSSASHDYFVSLSPDGLTLYFASARSGGAGGSDVWYSTRPNLSAAFTVVQNLSSINTAAGEYTVLVSADELEMYVASNRVINDIDVWVATREDTASPFGELTRITELGAPGEDHPGWISLDKRRLYFSSQRLGASQLFVTTRTCQ
jgi:hypothetical protein